MILCFRILLTRSHVTYYPPISLLNGCNVCFINCVLQIFYYISDVSERLDFCYLNGMKSPIVMALKDIFYEISSPVPAVRTSKYFHRLKGDYNWTLGTQQDSNEFLINVLQDLYTKKNDDNNSTTIGDLISNCPFNINVRRARQCIDCTKHSEKYTYNSTLPLSVNSENPTSIQKLVDECKHRQEVVQYNCHEADGEITNNTCQGTERFQTEDIISVSDYVIVQLNLFAFDRITLRQFKLKPDIEINQQITLAETTMNLCGIVFHSGVSVKTGHYTSAVQVEGT